MPSGIYKRTEYHIQKIRETNAKFLKGKKRLPLSEETKKKISNGNKGKKRSEKYKQELSKRMMGHKVLNETRKKISNIHKINNHKPIVRRGKECWNYKGGIELENKKIRKSLDYKIWRKSVFEKDDFKCRKCINGGYLHPHHIRNFAEEKDLRFAIDNGITLCKNCHLEFHKKYGIKNNNQKQLDNFIKI